MSNYNLMFKITSLFYLQKDKQVSGNALVCL